MDGYLQRLSLRKSWVVLGLGISLVMVVMFNVTFSKEVLENEETKEEEALPKAYYESVTNRVTVGASVIEGTYVWTAGTADSVIVLLPDINGNSPQAQVLAQNMSEADFTVIIIDYFNGNISNRPPTNVSLSYSLNVIKELYSRGYTDIQAQGYCYGGRVGVSLASMNDTVRTCVVAHPASLTNDDASLIIRPMFFEMPSNDTFNSLAPYFNTTLSLRGITATFKTYPNSTHGFAVSDTINPVQKTVALQDSINWFVANRQSASTTSSGTHLTFTFLLSLVVLLYIL